MTRPRSVLGALLLCALCICAFGAANASATTLYVCQEVEKGGKWEDSKCEKANEKGKFATVAVPENTATELVGAGSTPAFIKLLILTPGVGLTLECAKQSTTESATNQLVGGVMQSVGQKVGIKFTGCVGTQPPGENCKVKGGEVEFKIGSSTTFMKSETETRVEFLPPAETLFEFQLEGCKTEVLNMFVAIKGKLIGIPSGSSLVFNQESSEEGKITFGGGGVRVEGTLLVTAMEKRTMLE